MNIAKSRSITHAFINGNLSQTVLDERLVRVLGFESLISTKAQQAQYEEIVRGVAMCYRLIESDPKSLNSLFTVMAHNEDSFKADPKKWNIPKNERHRIDAIQTSLTNARQASGRSLEKLRVDLLSASKLPSSKSSFNSRSFAFQGIQFERSSNALGRNLTGTKELRAYSGCYNPDGDGNCGAIAALFVMVLSACRNNLDPCRLNAELSHVTGHEQAKELLTALLDQAKHGNEAKVLSAFMEDLKDKVTYYHPLQMLIRQMIYNKINPGVLCRGEKKPRINENRFYISSGELLAFLGSMNIVPKAFEVTTENGITPSIDIRDENANTLDDIALVLVGSNVLGKRATGYGNHWYAVSKRRLHR